MTTRLGMAALAFLASAAFSQQRLDPGHDPLVARYQANATTAGAAKITVQATATSDAVSFEQADITCAAAQTVTFYQNGTAATTTTLAIVGPLGPVSAVKVAAFSASNVGTGTTLKTFALLAGVTANFDLTAFSFPAGAGTSRNFSVGVDGVCTIQIQWRQP